MTSPIEITRKLNEAYILKNGDINDIVSNYLSELLYDMGNRYGMTELTHHIVAAAFKMHSDMLYSRLDEEGKSACDSIIKSADTVVQEIRFSGRPNKDGGKI